MVSAEVHICRCHVVERLMYPLVVVVVYERADLSLELPGNIIVTQLDHIFCRPVIPLDLSLGLRMIRSATGVTHILVSQIIARLPGDVAWSIVN